MAEISEDIVTKVTKEMMVAFREVFFDYSKKDMEFINKNYNMLIRNIIASIILTMTINWAHSIKSKDGEDDPEKAVIAMFDDVFFQAVRHAYLIYNDNDKPSNDKVH